MSINSKRSLKFISALVLFSILFLGSCKKKQEFKNEDGQAAVDAGNVQNENDAAIYDANSVIGDQGLLSGSTSFSERSSSVLGITCGLNLDTSQVFQGIVTLNYNGTVCNNRKREGQIKATIVNYPTKKWKQVGCVLKLEYIGYKVTNVSTGKNILLNGIVYITNESGGTWADLLVFGKANLIHKVDGSGIKVKYDGVKTAEYNILRRYTYTYSFPIITLKGEGLGSSDGKTNLENWGTTREGDNFTSEVITPIVWNSFCKAGSPIGGELLVKVSSKDFELKCTFAVDASGNAVTVTPSTCAYGWKVDWKYKNKTKQRIFPYN